MKRPARKVKADLANNINHIYISIPTENCMIFSENLRDN